MKAFLKIASYIFHPLLMPFLGAVLYYVVTPRFIEPQIKTATLSALVIITFLIPIVVFFLLKNLRLVTSIHLFSVRERKLPLMIHSLLILLVIKSIYTPYSNPELYFFFVGVLFSTIAALVLVLLGFKASLHQMAVAGVTAFLIGLSIHFTINLLPVIALSFIINGWVASSRLLNKAHSLMELIVGFVVGAFPQFILFNFWL